MRNKSLKWIKENGEWIRFAVHLIFDFFIRK